MKNKKGFTLVELMAVIVVLAIIIAIAVPTYGKIKRNMDEKSYENKVGLIEVSAEKYAEDTHYETMYVNDLIKAGYLDPDDKDGIIKNDITGKIINCYIVQVTVEKGMHYAKLIETDLEYDNGCPTNIPNEYNKILTVKMLNTETNEQITKENSYNWWVNTDVKLKADITLKEGQSIENIEWYKGSYAENSIPSTDRAFQIPENENKNIKDHLLVHTDSVLQENYIVKVKLNDGKIYNSMVRVYIDKINPRFYEDDKKQLKNEWVTKIDYGIKVYDRESGIYGYKLDTILENAPINCSTNKSEYKKLSEESKIPITANGNYQICIMDNVGNVHGDNRDIKTIDNIDPNVSTIKEINHGSNYVDINLTAQDMESGIDHFIVWYGESSSSMNSSKSFVSNNKNPGELVSLDITIDGLTSGKTYFFKSVAYDKAGNMLNSVAYDKAGNRLNTDTIRVTLCTWNTYRYYTTSKFLYTVQKSSFEHTSKCAGYATDNYYSTFVDTRHREQALFTFEIEGTYKVNGGTAKKTTISITRLETNICNFANQTKTNSFIYFSYGGNATNKSHYTTTNTSSFKTYVFTCDATRTGRTISVTFLRSNGMSIKGTLKKFTKDSTTIYNATSKGYTFKVKDISTTSAATSSVTASRVYCSALIPVINTIPYTVDVYSTYTASDINKSESGRNYYTTIPICED